MTSMPTQTSQMEGVVQAMMNSQWLAPETGVKWWRSDFHTVCLASLLFE